MSDSINTLKAQQGMSECGRAHGPNWIKWLAHLVGQPNVHGGEIGTFRADSAVWMLENVFTHETSTYTCIDPWLPEGSADLAAAGVDCTDNERVARERLRQWTDTKRCIIYKMLSADILKAFRRESLHMLYVDGDHRSKGVLQDSVLGFDVLRVGGIMIFDDYGWKVMPSIYDQPKTAINAFVQCYQRHVEALSPAGWQIALRKRSS